MQAETDTKETTDDAQLASEAIEAPAIVGSVGLDATTGSLFDIETKNDQ